MARLRALAFQRHECLAREGTGGSGLLHRAYSAMALPSPAATSGAGSISMRTPSPRMSSTTPGSYPRGFLVFWTRRCLCPGAAPAIPRGAGQARKHGGKADACRVASRSTRRLLAAILHGQLACAIETLADVWSLPLSRGIIALVLTIGLPVHWLHEFAIVCAAVALFYVC
jgi:hypothetical protein